ncbi:formylglycine-generating enzyme family protein [Brachybacterium sp. YJGR34]|uniref:formylglycine-generating enzyme family protein n=1 Tax=Brachybacterium sp. YJGR34 TaxID=2059911 RepID=UPI000E0B4A99|nr:formylglycine-generating enzyme family protein [Brachybacterium sp. YJGR34]
MSAPDHHPAGTGCGCGLSAPPRRGADAPARVVPAGAAGSHPIEQVRVPAGTFLMGDASGDANRADGETPRHEVALGAFDIDATPVTTAAFARFVEETGYRTEAERFGESAVFHLAVEAAEAERIGPTPGVPWWIGVLGADWQHPGGPGSSLAGLEEHPVVHVSWNDAQAYCTWAGRSLATEAQWEYAARGGLDGARYPWGDNPVDEGGWRANIFQGTFPRTNTLEDGFLTTAPGRSFEPNGYGLWQCVGNVWEWCRDWFHPGTYLERSRRGGTHIDPVGPETGHARVLRGGSYLCHDSYCNRYRCSARSRNTPDSSMGNAGFRTVSAPA